MAHVAKLMQYLLCTNKIPNSPENVTSGDFIWICTMCILWKHKIFRTKCKGEGPFITPPLNITVIRIVNTNSPKRKIVMNCQAIMLKKRVLGEPHLSSKPFKINWIKCFIICICWLIHHDGFHWACCSELIGFCIKEKCNGACNLDKIRYLWRQNTIAV